MKSADRRIS